MIIGIDVDDVLAQLQNTLVAWHNENYGTSLTYDDHNTFDLCKVWGCTKEERSQRLEEFFESDQVRNIKPILGSVETVKILNENHTLHVITARHEGLRKVTEDFLDEYFPSMFTKLHLIGQSDHTVTNKTKADVCKEIGAERMIEDGLHYAEECSKVGTNVLLLDVPWNQSDSLPKGVTRIKCWNEVLDHL